jgi:hypothetical protein
MAKRIGLAALFALIATTPAAAGPCAWFGTQIDCVFGSTDLVIGTQTSAETGHTSSVGTSSFNWDGRLMNNSTSSPGRWRVELQNFGRDPRLCRDIDGERYCY